MTHEEWLAGKCQGCGLTREHCRRAKVCRPSCAGGWDAVFARINEWSRQTFTSASPRSKAAHLLKEVKELHRAIEDDDHPKTSPRKQPTA